MNPPCLTCGSTASVQMHHVAGRHNLPDLVVPVCADCHLILTNWQLAAGTELHAEAPRSSLDVARALIVGTLHLCQLTAQRRTEGTHRASVSAQLSELMARACSMVLDDVSDPDRPGRWIPDPTMPLREGTPVGTADDHELARVREWAGLLDHLTETFGVLLTFPWVAGWWVRRSRGRSWR